VPVDFTSALHVARRLLESNQGWLAFLRIDFDGGEQARLVRANTHRVLDGMTWQRCDFEIEMSAMTADAGQSATLTLPNIQRVAAAAIVQDRILGDGITFALVHESETTMDMGRAFTFDGLKATIQGDVVRIESGFNPDLLQAPRRSYSRTRYRQMLPTAGYRRRW
jgi:hypothetical protein